MNRTGLILPPEDDPDPTDRLPGLDEGAIAVGKDVLESTGTWSSSGADLADRVAELERTLEERDTALADLTSLLRQRTFAATRVEKELEQARSELMRARSSPGRQAGLEQRLNAVERERLTLAAQHDEQRSVIGRLEDQPHLPRDCASTWPVEVPAVFAVQTVWAQSGIEALRRTGRAEEVGQFDVGLLHAMCGVLNRGHWKTTLRSYDRALRAAGTGRLRGATALGSGFARAWALRARWFGGRLLRRPYYVGAWQTSGLPDVAAAVNALEARLDGLPAPPWAR